MQRRPPGMKMEEASQVDPKPVEGLEGARKTSHVIERSCIREFLQKMPAPQIKEEASEGLIQRWEVQWQDFLKEAESPRTGWGLPQLPDEPAPWDDAKAFLASFEQVAEACRWPKEEWVNRLLPALRGEAEQVFSRLEAQDRKDYRKVKAAILRGDAFNREKSRQHFRHFCYQEAEGPREAYSRLQELCHQWLKVERHTKEQILELLILEQFLTVLPSEIQNWVRERGPETCAQAVALAESFLQMQREVERQKSQVAPSFEEVVLSFCEPEAVPSTPSSHRPLPKETKQEDGNGETILMGAKEWMTIGEGGELVPEGSEQLAPHMPTIWRATENIPGICEQRTFLGSHLEVSSRQGVDISVTSGGPFQDLKEDVFQRRFHPDVGQASGNRENIGHEDITEECEPHRMSPRRAREDLSYGQGVSKASEKKQNRKPGDEPETTGAKSSSSEVNKIFAETGIEPQRKACVVVGKHLRNTGLFKKVKNSNGEMLYLCTECGESFKHKKHLTMHQRAHRRNTFYDCSACEKSFVWMEDLTRHQRIHTGEKPYTCSICGNGYSSRSGFIHHRRIHAEEKPFQCSDCDKGFVCKSHLTRHQRTHQDRKLYTCTECDKSFCQISLLMLHKITHAAEKPGLLS
ncbi:zinc finger protein 397-like [Sceloporus undulatus]|uniref:zinc finger protein 397-like n=1 Tax=Sceloporus undulatus TaxID=8520 RepID=UPI001C4D98EF|nr:zinc finger protein 397-like [Sceloporus undulatus]